MLRVFEGRILSVYLGPLDYEELHSLYTYLIVRVIKSRIRWADHVARMNKDRNPFKILTCKPTGKRPLGRRRLRLQDTVSMNLK